MQKKINLNQIICDHIDTIKSIESHELKINKIVSNIKKCFKKKGRLILCGNGGSASDASHFAAELVGRFKKDRKGFDVICLSSDSSIITAIGNDYGYEKVFSKQLESIVKNKNDLFFVISTSGNSKNIIDGLKYCKLNGIQTIGLIGGDGGKAKKYLDENIIINSKSTARIQEAHITLIHVICEFFE